ncbi:hypothetical protein G6F56_000885 [Rhizopus delemar]|uniref:Alpha-ketoglutarate-dependent dioxygenase AlkB-like domain-containing protein n=1 Tax=Rhizopus stolonifer TaxID=4846 RepID=A0A367KUV9_RHIST|nr:hypothetical protein G6F56_000885 [Rhizopus delemar]RCI05944.1 hypothetical protein CU098_013076 [Rhizopus stolonifer]
MSTPQFKSKRQQKIWERERQEVESKKKNASSYVNQAPFRYCERNFKSRVPPPDYSQVIDLGDLPGKHNPEILNELVPVKLTQDLSQLSSLFGDRPCEDAYLLKNVPGLIVIPNAFTPQAQIHLIKQCLSLYPRPPNTSNLDTHYNMPDGGLWPLYERETSGKLTARDPEFYIPKKAPVEESESDSEPETVVVCRRELTACSDDFKPVIDEPKPDPAPASTVPLLPPSELVRKLRWVTLGYQYHWPTKTYHLDRRYPFPEDVAEFTKAVVYAIENVGYDDGKEAWKNEYKGDDFVAEAGVINYYQYRDTLMGHVDRSELNMEAPLVSLSLGHSCIYLIGGATRETVPTPLLLRSGDIIVMTGPCRKAFHGVPLIIENSLPEYLSNEEDPDYKLFGDFMSTSRINLNIRQVYPPGEKK